MSAALKVGSPVSMAELCGSTQGWALDDDIVHTNHGSFGGISLATRDALVAARDRVAANPMGFFSREFPQAHRDAVTAVAGLVGTRPKDTALVANATVGMDVALRVLPWRRGATVVTTNQAYPSVLANLHRRAARSGTSVMVVPIDPFAPDVVVDTLAAAVDDAGTRGPVGLVVDQVASATAMPFPVHALVTEAGNRGVVVVVDAAHVPGQVSPELANPGADAWTGNLHKWACAPSSLAALVVDERHHATIGSVVSSWHDELPFPANSSWQGTADPGPLLVAGQVVDQAMAILGRSEDIEGLAIAGAAHVAQTVEGEVVPGHGWMRTVRLPGSAVATATTLPELAARALAIERPLWQRGIEAKVTPFDGDLLLRISCHAYSASRDHDRLADALRSTLLG